MEHTNARKKTSLSNLSDHGPGTKLRERRLKLCFTMYFVVNQTGLSTGFISQIQTRHSSASLSLLAAINKVLQLPVAYFLEQPPEAGQPIIHKATRQSFQTVATTNRSERLSTELEGSSIRALIVHEPAGHHAEQPSHIGEELLYVLKSSVCTLDVFDQDSFIVKNSKHI